MNNKISRAKKFLFVIVGALLLAFAYPPFTTGFTAWFCLIPLFLVLDDETVWGSFIWGYIYGFLVAILGLWWIVYPTVPGMFMAVIYLGVYWAFFAAIYRLFLRIGKTVAFISTPFLLVFMEYIRGMGRMGFPWQDLAYTQTYYNKFIQIADTLGSPGISFWVASLNVLIYIAFMSLLNKKIRSALYSILVLIMFIGGFWFYGYSTLKREIYDIDTLKVALLQGNIDPYQKWERGKRHYSREVYTDMIDSAILHNPALIIMPESATAGYWRRKSTKFEVYVERSLKSNIPILTGTLDYNPRNRLEYYNAAYLINPNGKDQIYYKMQPVPISEQIPWQEESKFLRNIDVGGSHFTRGEEPVVFELDSAKFSVPICYEALFSRICRTFRKNGAQFIVAITNDGWFKRSPGSYQNFRFNILRAIENRVYIARAANTGISAIIDQYGRIERKTDIYKTEIILGEIGVAGDDLTFYTKYGNIVSWISLGYVPILIFLVLFKGEK
ncbi:MAG: apolipoprotein N-acyltransferase [Candidatus Zixiibacteriota bacterium]